EMLGGLKGVVVDFVVRHVKKLVPAFSLPNATRFKQALADGARMTLSPVQIAHDDVAFLQYTGGTTGVAKGATLLHRNVLANTLQNDAWAQPALARGVKVEALNIVCALPLYHIFALTA